MGTEERGEAKPCVGFDEREPNGEGGKQELGYGSSVGRVARACPRTHVRGQGNGGRDQGMLRGSGQVTVWPGVSRSSGSSTGSGVHVRSCGGGLALDSVASAGAAGGEAR